MFALQQNKENESPFEIIKGLCYLAYCGTVYGTWGV